MQRQISNPRPFLKWAGGKSQLLPELLKRLPQEFDAYHEPFVGGGALFFQLARAGRLRNAYLSDINQSLIDAYVALRDHVEEVIRILRQHRYEETYYYQVRSLQPDSLSLPERAARTIYLNRTCYNGLYRENRAGRFNVPFGRYKNPLICDEPNLRAVSSALANVDISCRPFERVPDHARAGDLVYFDPPYHPLSSTSSFTSYDRNGFGPEEQVALRDTFSDLAQSGVKVVLSNSDTLFVRGLYDGHRVSTVHALRAINSRPEARGKVAEVIVCSGFDVAEVAQSMWPEKGKDVRRPTTHPGASDMRC